MIPKKQLEEIKREITECQNPFFFFHDDPDGLCSFLLLRKLRGEGSWHMVKPRPLIDENFVKLVPADCDKVFIVDIAIVRQDFVDNVKKPVVWIDHHTPLEIRGCRYFNPRIKNPEEYTPASAICYEAVKSDDQDLLLGMLGTVGDLADEQKFYRDFFKKYSELADGCRDKFDLMFKTRLGTLTKMLEFNLKGNPSEVKKSLKIFTRQKDFARLLEPETAAEKFVFRKYEQVKAEYDEHLENAMRQKSGDVFVFTYKEKNFTLGSDIAQEIPYRIPGKKIYIICREKAGQHLCSLRTGKGIDLVKFLKKALTQVEGFGGGHPFAAGCNIKSYDFERFVELAKEE